MQNKFKFRKALFVDYMLFIFLISPIILIGIMIYLIITDNASMEVSIGFSGLALIGVLLLFNRLYSMKKLFYNGNEIDGYIQEVLFFKDRGSIIYFYNYNGVNYTKSTAVMKSKITKSLYNSMQVKVIVNIQNPKKAIIKNIFV